MSARADAPRPAWRWIAAIRVDEVLVLQGAPFLGAAFALAGGASASWGTLALFGVASGALVAHVFALNDWSEMPPRADTLPLDRGETRALFLALLVLSLGLFALVGAWPLLLASAVALLSALYSAPAILGKGTPIASSALHLAGGALHFLLGYSLRGAPDIRGVSIAVVFGLTFAAGHLTQEVRDRDEDLRNGIRTNAVAFGKTAAFVAGLALFTLSDALLATLALLGVVPRIVAPAIAALWLLHVVWSLRVLGGGLPRHGVRRLQWKYRARYAAIGILTVAALLGG